MKDDRDHGRPRRERHLKQKYGLTHDDVERIWEAQGRACAICGASPDDPARHVDHDHRPGAPKGARGILCRACNLGLGAFRDSVLLLKRATDYLVRYRIENEDP